jgi:DNA-binding transcriptional LysR family regulator
VADFLSAAHNGELGGDARVVAVPIDAPPIVGGVYAVALPESLDLPAVRAFIEAGQACGSAG